MKVAGKDEVGRKSQIQIMLRNNESVTRELPAGVTQREAAALTALSKLSPHISILEAERVCKSPYL